MSKELYTIVPETGAIIMSHVFKNDEGKRIAIVDDNVNVPAEFPEGYEYVYTAYATSEQARSYLDIPFEHRRSIQCTVN